MRIRLVLAGLLLAATAQAQSTPPTPDKPLVYTMVEQMPQPPGGLPALLQTLSAQLNYPAEALQQHLEGKVFVTFVVAATGLVEQARVLKGTHPLLDAEALRVISQMPAWTPGRQNGQAVNVWYTLPITFRLPEQQPATAPAATKYPFDVAAEYPGGMERMRQDVRKALRTTAKAQMKGAQGRMFVTFVVAATGQVRDVSITRGLDAALDAAVVQAFQQLRPWKPAQYQGRPVPVSFTMPLTFGPNAL